MASPQQTNGLLNKDQANKVGEHKRGLICELGSPSVENAKGLKRAASPKQVCCKRHRAHSSPRASSGDPHTVSLKHTTPRSNKRKASPETETSRKKRRNTTVSVDQRCTAGVKGEASTVGKVSRKRLELSSSRDTASSKPNKSLEEASDGQNEGQAGTAGKAKYEVKWAGEEDVDEFFSSGYSSSDSEPIIPEEHSNFAYFDQKYIQKGRLGEGGFGSVFAGYRRTDFMPVAIKRVQDPAVESDLRLYGVPLEVALMQKAIGGPGESAIIRLFDWYYIDEELIMVMERLVPSDDLGTYLWERRDPLREDEAKMFMTQMVKGATEMHQKGVFHRDIKVENVLVDLSSTIPRLKIIDFGCGTFEVGETFTTFSGTPALAPPEWFYNAAYSAAPTTVWQLGVLMYSMLHTSVFNTKKFLSGKNDFNSGLSRECLSFLRLCLAPFPEDRGILEQLRLHPWLC